MPGRVVIPRAVSGSLIGTEIPQGTIDGVNLTFTTTQPPVGVMLRGLWLAEGLHYTFPTPTTIQFAAGFAPIPPDQLFALVVLNP